MCTPRAPKMPEMPAPPPPPPQMQDVKAPDTNAARRRPSQQGGIAGGTLLTGPMGGMAGANVGGSTLLGG